MSEIKHTPGPWNLHKHAFACVTSEKMMVANCAVTTSNIEDLQPTQMANARLIAAAPDLLEAVAGLIRLSEAIRHSVGLGKNQLERIERAKAAIAKAEGRQP